MSLVFFSPRIPSLSFIASLSVIFHYITQGRALFDQSVIKSPNRSVPVGLGLEILVQSLVQDDFDCHGTDKVKLNSVLLAVAAIPWTDRPQLSALTRGRKTESDSLHASVCVSNSLSLNSYLLV